MWERIHLFDYLSGFPGAKNQTCDEPCAKTWEVLYQFNCLSPFPGDEIYAYHELAAKLWEHNLGDISTTVNVRPLKEFANNFEGSCPDLIRVR